MKTSSTKNIESAAVSQSAKRDRAKPPRESHSAGDSRAPLHWPRKTRLESRRVYPHAGSKCFVSTRTAFVTSVAMTKLLSLLDEISIGPHRFDTRSVVQRRQVTFRCKTQLRLQVLRRLVLQLFLRRTHPASAMLERDAVFSIRQLQKPSCVIRAHLQQ